MTVDRNTKGGNKMSKKFLKMSIVLGMGLALMMGNMSVYAASSSGKASIKNTGKNVKYKFTVATKGY